METPTEILHFQGPCMTKSTHEACGTEAFQMSVSISHAPAQTGQTGATSHTRGQQRDASSVWPHRLDSHIRWSPALSFLGTLQGSVMWSLLLSQPTTRAHSFCAFIFSNLLAGFLTQSWQSSSVQLYLKQQGSD